MKYQTDEVKKAMLALEKARAAAKVAQESAEKEMAAEKEKQVKIVESCMKLFKVKTPADLVNAIKSVSDVSGTRAKITDEVKKQAISLLKEGQTGNQVAETLHISTASVNNIKKAAGLTRARAVAKAA